MVISLGKVNYLCYTIPLAMSIYNPLSVSFHLGCKCVTCSDTETMYPAFHPAHFPGLSLKSLLGNEAAM